MSPLRMGEDRTPQDRELPMSTPVVGGEEGFWVVDEAGTNGKWVKTSAEADIEATNRFHANPTRPILIIPAMGWKYADLSKG